MAAPVRPSAGDLADPAFWTAEVYNRWVALYGSWNTYTPVWSTSNATQPAVIGGSLTGRYKFIGKTVWFSIRFVAGGSTTFGDGLWSFSLPSGLVPTSVQSAPGVIIGPSSTRYPAAAWLSSSTGVFRIIPFGGTGGVRTNAGSGNDVPFEWGSGSAIVLGGVYEAN